MLFLTKRREREGGEEREKGREKEKGRETDRKRKRVSLWPQVSTADWL